MITFEPIEEELFKDDTTLPYKITDMAEGFTNNGNDKLILTLELTDDDGGKHILETDLIFSIKAMYRIREFSVSSATYDQFKSGQFPYLKGKTGILTLGYDENPGYRPKNFVKKWVESQQGLKQVDDFKSGKLKADPKAAGNTNYNPDDPKNDIPF